MTDPFTMARFLSFADQSAANGCWEWTGEENTNGYGRFSHQEQKSLAHRFSYELFFGDVPAGLNVCHRCDNRKCVNPSHLWLGSQSANLSDAVSKGRMHRPDTRGHRNGNTTLTWEKVRAIRDLDSRGIRKFRIAKLFGVSPSTVTNITTLATWKEEHRA
jgi:hypothetical protein